MQKFQFALEKALAWRATRLQLESAKLAQLRQERIALLQLSENLANSASQAARGVFDNARTLTGADLCRLATYRQIVAARLKRLAGTVREFDEHIQQQTRRVVEADREKQLLEKLKARQFEDWEYELKREIENTAGELFLARWSL